jgi:RNA polymerase sigma-70 factor (ECF subfamily)
MENRQLKNEEELLARIATGDQRAFTEIFDFYHRYVYAYGRKMTKSEDQANEIVQDVFLKIWLNREKLNEVNNFGAYLNRVVRNHSLNVIRKLAQDARSATQLKINNPESENATDKILDYNESNRILSQAIENLSPQQRTVYTLCHIEGLKYDEAAKKMNVSSRTVQAHMVQALRHIREHFNKHALTYPALFAVLFK